ncbi:MAG TPA: hypothetical protein VJ124_00845 [Pyrinomonadaceae bacterium]|nr:hypothetical protein [Pyrinomonadaceae bacterium]
MLAERQSLNQRQAHYVETVLARYRKLPDTPNRHSRYDRRLALQLYPQQLPLSLIDNAFLLATARRLLRDPSYPPHNPIRSLHYFLPVIEELLDQSPPPAYFAYLRSKLALLLNPTNKS